MAFARAAKSGIVTSADFGTRGGQMRATGRVRFNTVTSSPSATHFNTVPKSSRTCLIVAVLIM
jgi:hypothetical protein